MNYKFVLVNNETGMMEQQWVLSPPLVVGRCPTADITIEDGSISRRHCQFLTDPHGSLMVRDLSSKNGVYVDQTRVERSVVPIRAEVRLGLATLRIELTDESEETAAENTASPAYDMAETEKVKIVRPQDDVYEIG